MGHTFWHFNVRCFFFDLFIVSLIRLRIIVVHSCFVIFVFKFPLDLQIIGFFFVVLAWGEY